VQISQATQRSRVDRRDTVERLLHYAEYLAPGDRALLRAVYDRGMSVAEFARASGASAKFIRGRLRRLINRINAEEFQFTIRHMHAWPARRRAVATAMILHGLSMRDAARSLGMSIHQVRQHLQHIRVLYQSAGAAETDRHART